MLRRLPASSTVPSRRAETRKKRLKSGLLQLFPGNPKKSQRLIPAAQGPDRMGP